MGSPRAADNRDIPLRTDAGGLLTGMIYCAECGERLTINRRKKVYDTTTGREIITGLLRTSSFNSLFIAPSFRRIIFSDMAAAFPGESCVVD